MLNRRHIRVKVMQVLYMYWQSGKDHKIEQIQHEFDRNVNRMYQLYLYYFAFLKELYFFIDKYDDEVTQRYVRENRLESSHLLLKTNIVLINLLKGDVLEKELTKHKVVWNDQTADSLVKKVFLDLKNSQRYQDYLSQHDHPSVQADMIYYIIKHYSEGFNLFEQHFEEEFPNYFDDVKLVFSMLKKSISKLANDEPDFFVSLVQDKENTIDFGHALIRKVIANDVEIQPIIDSKITKWDPNQIALIDAIILRMGVAEFKYFPSIPRTVTINEYVELAKQYSPPQSKKFINGLLDSVSRDMASNEGNALSS